MRTATVTIRPRDGWADSAIEPLARATDVTLVGIHNQKRFFDGSIAILYEFEGSPSSYRAAVASNDSVRDLRIVADRDPSLAYLHFEPTPSIGELLYLTETHPVFIDSPMRFLGDDALRVTVIGPIDAIRSVVDAVPDSVEYTIDRFRQYHPTPTQPYSELSSRQREVLRLAIELGYYRDPRQATQSDIASHLDCTASTVGGHLRRIEKRLIEEFLPRPEGGLGEGV